MNCGPLVGSLHVLDEPNVHFFPSVKLFLSLDGQSFPLLETLLSFLRGGDRCFKFFNFDPELFVRLFVLAVLIDNDPFVQSAQLLLRVLPLAVLSGGKCPDESRKLDDLFIRQLVASVPLHLESLDLLLDRLV